VGAVSWRCGFADASDFSKRFRVRFGLSPSEWHRQAWMTPERAEPLVRSDGFDGNRSRSGE
jgi:AraC-like DNA-binding protein